MNRYPDVKPSYPCPCCGFVVFDEEPGSYAICPICDWEDDHVQLCYPSLIGGANRYSLWQGQLRVLARYPVAVMEANGYIRDPLWRPLRFEELTMERVPQTGTEYFDMAANERPTYYWTQSGSANENIDQSIDVE